MHWLKHDLLLANYVLLFVIFFFVCKKMLFFSVFFFTRFRLGAGRVSTDSFCTEALFAVAAHLLNKRLWYTTELFNSDIIVTFIRLCLAKISQKKS